MSRAKEASVIEEGIKMRLKCGLNNTIGGSASIQTSKIKSKRQVIRDINEKRSHITIISNMGSQIQR